VRVLWNKQVDRFLGDPLAGGLTGLALTDTVTGEASTFAAEGAFVAIGHAPATELFKDKLPMDASGYLLVDPGTPKTAIPGVFACGDVMDPVYRQAVTAAGTGCMAALDAERFVAEREFAAHKVAEAAE
jgi:thioredoxin reductase (NADPH)